jgi:hypothetical protein
MTVDQRRVSDVASHFGRDVLWIAVAERVELVVRREELVGEIRDAAAHGDEAMRAAVYDELEDVLLMLAEWRAAPAGIEVPAREARWYGIRKVG